MGPSETGTTTLYSSDDSSDDYANTNTNTTDFTQEQLHSLQSLIQTSTQKTEDARVILEETRDYLQRIHQETEQIQKEVLTQQRADVQGGSSSSSSSNQSISPGSAQGPLILKVEVEELMEGSFVVKISWTRGRVGGTGHVQRVIECLDVKMTSIVVKETIAADSSSDQMLSTAFIEEMARKTARDFTELGELSIPWNVRLKLWDA